MSNILPTSENNNGHNNLKPKVWSVFAKNFRKLAERHPGAVVAIGVVDAVFGYFTSSAFIDAHHAEYGLLTALCSFAIFVGCLASLIVSNKTHLPFHDFDPTISRKNITKGKESFEVIAKGKGKKKKDKGPKHLSDGRFKEFIELETIIVSENSFKREQQFVEGLLFNEGNQSYLENAFDFDKFQIRKVIPNLNDIQCLKQKESLPNIPSILTKPIDVKEREVDKSQILDFKPIIFNVDYNSFVNSKENQEDSNIATRKKQSQLFSISLN